MTDKELKQACIYDLTSDEEVLREVLGVLEGEKIPTKEEYLASCKSGEYVEEAIWSSMLEYAEDIMKDEGLTQQLKRVFKGELQAFFNE